MTTIFSKIIAKEIPADIVEENDKIIVIKDIHPKAPVHLLIIPKKEIPNLQSMKEDDLDLMKEIIKTVQKLARENQIEEGYRLVVNNGLLAGQSISHLHFHLLGGNGGKFKKMV